MLSVALAACGGGTSEQAAPKLRPAGKAPVVISPQLARLRQVVEAELHAAGPNSGAMVYDVTANHPLLSVRASIKRAPASLEKLYTSVALLDRLGANARLQTKLLGTGHLQAGVWHGDLYLRGGGDPTFGDTAIA